MRWESWECRRRRKFEAQGWHYWWAWYPVRIDCTWYWLTRIRRHRSISWFDSSTICQYHHPFKG